MKSAFSIQFGKLASALTLAAGLAFAPVVATTSSAQAQAFPEKPVQLIVPYRAGGGTDTMARVFAKAMTKELGQPVVVVNHKGGGGAVGGSVLANSEPDGYTVLMGGDDIPAYIPHASEVDFSYDSFRPIAAVAEYQNAFIAKAGAPYGSFEEFVEYAKANPGVKLAHIGGITQLFVDELVSQSGIDARVVTASGGAEVTQLLLSGQVEAGYSGGIHNQNPELWDVIGSFNESRLPNAADKSTFAEAGYGMSMPAKIVFLTPAGVPDDIAATLEQAITAAAADADFVTIVEERLKAPVAMVSSSDLKAYLDGLNDNLSKITAN
ncbi:MULTISPECIES: tripartite tricarboxylate transporter substrate binding protein [unclassified Roseovarius]|uniref:Bug family tripartite tricarboxylate transporter substrate binding protein n=1 Tax=unclassified Roseovarius TaxID=2614913 RepID=UPI00273E722D|nr:MULTISPECIES: tripartite tricarboxylate transporter substrate binding protein [unclassified Roseovarius]